MTTPSAAEATSTPSVLRLDIRHARRSVVVISVLRTRQGLDARDDGIGGNWTPTALLHTTEFADKIRPDLNLTLGGAPTGG
jgi:hypothetical protein